MTTNVVKSCIHFIMCQRWGTFIFQWIEFSTKCRKSGKKNIYINKTYKTVICFHVDDDMLESVRVYWRTVCVFIVKNVSSGAVQKSGCVCLPKDNFPLSFKGT